MRIIRSKSSSCTGQPQRSLCALIRVVMVSCFRLKPSQRACQGENVPALQPREGSVTPALLSQHSPHPSPPPRANWFTPTPLHPNSRLLQLLQAKPGSPDFQQQGHLNLHSPKKSCSCRLIPAFSSSACQPQALPQLAGTFKTFQRGFASRQDLKEGWRRSSLVLKVPTGLGCLSHTLEDLKRVVKRDGNGFYLPSSPGRQEHAPGSCTKPFSGF